MDSTDPLRVEPTAHRDGPVSESHRATPASRGKSAHAKRREKTPGLTGLEMIAAFKFLKAATFIAVGLGSFGLMNPGVADAAQDWLERLALGTEHRLASELAAHLVPFLDTATPRRFAALGLGALLYACVFLTEGIGLWTGKRWAEYLTIGVTVSLLPLEVVAIIHRVTVVRVGALLLNVAIVVYLLWQLRASLRRDRELRAAGQGIRS